MNQEISYPLIGNVEQITMKEEYEWNLSHDEVNLLSGEQDRSIREVANLFNSERRIP